MATSPLLLPSLQLSNPSGIIFPTASCAREKFVYFFQSLFFYIMKGINWVVSVLTCFGSKIMQGGRYIALTFSSLCNQYPHIIFPILGATGIIVIILVITSIILPIIYYCCCKRGVAV